MPTINPALIAQISSALSVAEQIASVVFPGAGPAISIGVKIAQGVAAEAPQAIALWDQFQNGVIPAQSELDAYATAEDGDYAKLMADIAAAQK